MNDPTRPARVALRVSDVQRSADFYREIVGLEVAAADADAATLIAPGGQTLLELRRAETPGRAVRRATGLFHTAFLYPGRAGLGAALTRIAQTRTPLTGASDHLVSEALYLDDPDGHGIELYRDRPRAEWPQPDPGEKVKMDTIPLPLEPILAAAAPDRGSDGVVVGHVHLKVGDVQQAVDFWTGEVGMELMAHFGSQAAFLASGDYHHHIGANTWHSAGAGPEPADGPGLDEVVLHGDHAQELRSPDGIRIVIE
ncbi:MAG TPA: VOC family protein [Solirubrobacteraceae bacterium]